VTKMNLTYRNFTVPMVDKHYLESCLFVCVSGSHSFGWETEKSDLDLRYIEVTDLAQIISPFFPNRPRQKIKDNIDSNYYPLRDYLMLLAKGNGNALDNLFEPKLWEQKESVRELQEIIQTHIHKGILAHCLGYSHAICKDFTIPNRLQKYGIQKLLLCRYRILLQGMLILQGIIEYNLPRMLTQVPTQHCEKLLSDYKAGIETPETELEIMAKETETIHQLLWEKKDNANIPDQFHSCVEVPLGRWIEQKYLGKKVTQDR
jgi:uncharacterized protein